MNEDKLKKLYTDEMNASAPDMDALWQRIEEGITDKKQDAQPQSRRAFITLKKVLACAAACIVMAVAVPSAINLVSTKSAESMADKMAIAADESPMHMENAGAADDAEQPKDNGGILRYEQLDIVRGGGNYPVSGEPFGGEYFVEEDVLLDTEQIIDGVVNHVYADPDSGCVYYELSAVNVYGGEAEDTITVASRSRHTMKQGAEYIVPVKSVDGELRTVNDSVPQIEVTNDGGIVYYNGWSALDNDTSESILYPQGKVDDFFYDRMKFSYTKDLSAMIEKWESLRG